MTRTAPLAACLALFAASAAASPISGARQLTFEGARAGEGYFSADGTAMIFQSEREPDNPFYQIYLMDLETGDVDRVSPGHGKTTCGWIHPAGDRVMFASTQFDPEARATMQAEIDFRNSGQTRRYSWDYDPSYEIVERDLATGEFTRLTDALGYDAEGAYSPDGTKIVFASNRHAYADPNVDAEALERDPSFFMDIYVMDADGGNVTRLTDAPGYDGGSFWSADGAKITWRRFSEDGATAEVYTMNADGSAQTALTDMGVMSWAPYFHPSGEYLIFSTNLNGFANFELYLVDAAGLRVPVRVSDRDGFDGLPAFSPDGARLSWTAKGAGGSQIWIADWDHDAALAMLAEAPMREQAAAPTEGTSVKIAAADLRTHVAALASEEMEGRLTGTPGARLATQYVADAFAALGLEPAGDDGGWFHEFEFTSGVSLGGGAAASLSIDGEAAPLTVGETWTPLPFSATGEAAEGSVAFVGYGLVAPGDGASPAVDSYGDLDVTDKWVLIWRGAPAGVDESERRRLIRFADMRYKSAVAQERGAKGVILTPPPDEGFGDALPSLSYDSIGGAARLPVVAVNRATGARMLSILRDREDRTAKLERGESAAIDLIGVNLTATVDLTFEKGVGRNVLGRLPSGAAAPAVVIGGHVDHLGRGGGSSSLAGADEAGMIHYGADDNASGVAAMIEVAQKMAADHAAGKLKPKRDVIFAAWSGEELGLLGATAWLEALDDPKAAVAAYLNLDMVGRLEDKVVASGLGSSPIWAREIERRNAVVGLPIRTSEDTYPPTDAMAFYLAGAPILSLFTGAHEDYHRPSDTPEKLNYQGLEDIARFTALVARSLARADAAPEYVKVARQRPEGRARGGVFLGTIPDYATDGVVGVPISGVVKGGPAEAAGLQGGDVIVGLDGADLANIYDYIRVLNGLKPGAEVEIEVTRGGDQLVLSVTPGRRD